MQRVSLVLNGADAFAVVEIDIARAIRPHQPRHYGASQSVYAIAEARLRTRGQHAVHREMRGIGFVARSDEAPDFGCLLQALCHDFREARYRYRAEEIDGVEKP